MRLLVLLTLISLLLSHCSLQRRCAALYPVGRDTTEHTFDTSFTHERITYRDVPVYLPMVSDPILIHDVLPAAGKDYSATSKGRNGSVTVHISNGILDVNCKADSLQHLLARVSDTLREVQQKTVLNRTITITRTITIKVKKLYIPWWIWAYITATLFFIYIKFHTAFIGMGARLVGKFTKL